MPRKTAFFYFYGEISGLICFDLSSLTAYFLRTAEPRVVLGCYLPDALGQDTARQIATVDHADMRGLVTDLTSLRRGAGLSLVAGIIDQECPLGLSCWPMPV